MRTNIISTITGSILLLCCLVAIYISNTTGFTRAVFNTCSELIHSPSIVPYVPTKSLDQQLKEELEQRNGVIRTDKLIIRDIINIQEPRQYSV